jgi:putative ABC transport system permease protein
MSAPNGSRPGTHHSLDAPEPGSHARGAASAITTRASIAARWSLMGRVGLAMMFHDKSKLLGTLVGVIFAVVLSNQQAGTFLGLIQKNVMLVDNAGADFWITPKASESLLSAAGQTVNTAALHRARTTPGVAWAEPILLTVGNVRLPDGGSQQVQIIGTRLPACKGGPWNIVAGKCDDLARPDTLIVEHGERLTLGGLNVGSVREINGRNMTVVGFTWGLIPFGPSYAFTDFETARELAHAPSDQVSFVLVGLEPGADAAVVQARLANASPEAKVLTKQAWSSSIVRDLLTRSAIGITFGTSALFGLLVGLVIVGLSMFSAVVDNVREFGTLKAIGCTNLDLGLLLMVQSLSYALIGSLIGLALVTRMAAGIRSAKLALMMPPWLTFGTLGLMIVLCALASLLALVRIRKVEPAMVFR